MGQTNDTKAEGRGKKKSVGRRGRAGTSEGYPLTLETIITLYPLVAVVANAGGAIRVGKTRDGGALALGIYVGEDVGTEYVRPSEDLHDACEEILAAWLPQAATEYAETREAVYSVASRLLKP